MMVTTWWPFCGKSKQNCITYLRYEVRQQVMIVIT